jgi:hypothetical protein
LCDELTFVGVPVEGDDSDVVEELVPGGKSIRVTEQNKHKPVTSRFKAQRSLLLLFLGYAGDSYHRCGLG